MDPEQKSGVGAIIFSTTQMQLQYNILYLNSKTLL